MAVDDAILVGGLLRCCIETIRERSMPSKIGDVINCKNTKKCNARMIFKAGVANPEGAWYWYPRLRSTGS